MFWFGLVISLCSGLVSIGLSRDAFKNRFPRSKGLHLDWVALALLIIGLVVAAVDYRNASKKLIALTIELKDFKEYEWLARLDMFGRPYKGKAGAIIIETDLTRAFAGFYEEGSTKTTFRNDAQAIQRYREIAKSYSKFPLPSYVLAVALFKTNDPEWRAQATIVRETIYKITLISEHHGWYDDALVALDRMLQSQ